MAAATLITGASGGIGTAIALALARRGHRLVLHGRREPALDALVRRCADAGAGDAQAIALDLSAPEAPAELVARASDRVGPLQVVVNAVGIPRRVDARRLGPHDVDELWAVDARAPIGVVLAALPGMLAAADGRLVNIGSLAGRLPPPREAAYAAAKHALAGFTDVLRIDLEGSGVRVHLVTPAVIDTPLWAAAGQESAAVRHAGLAPQRVAAAVLRLMDGGGYEAYVPRRARLAAILRPVLGRAFLSGAARFDRLRR